MNLDSLLRESSDVAEPSPDALLAGRAALDAALAASPGPVVPLRRGRRLRRFGLTAAVAAAASLALVIGPTIDLGGNGAPAASASAAELLLRAGAAAGAQPGGWPDAAYWHSVSSYKQGSGDTHHREIWIGHEKIGVLSDDGVDTGVIPLGVASFPAGGRSLSWAQLYALPTDPAALEADLRAGINGAGPDDDTELFVIVGDLLRESPAPPPLRKALWEVAARVPDVELVGAVTDGSGRPGVAVERGDQRYVVDPDSGRLLEENEGPNGDAWRATYLEQGPADTAPEVTNLGVKSAKPAG